jgi:glycogen(starch) synthase
MRILMATERFLPDVGGVEMFTARLATALVERGHEVAVVTSRPGLTELEEERCGAIRVYRFPFEDSLSNRDHARVIALRRHLAELKRAIQPHVVHLNTSGASLVFHLLTRNAAAAPTVVTVHWLPNRPGFDAQLCRRALVAANWVVAVTRGCLHDALALDAGIAERTSVIYNSLPPIDLRPAPLPFDPPRLLCLGRIEAQKGFDVAIRALAEARERVAGVQITVAGDGSQRQALERLAADLGLTGAVRFIGWVPPDEIPRLINQHTLVVMPSRYEPFGLVALQAAQLGRPMVASRIPGLSEVVRDRDTGWLCTMDDPTAFATAITSLLQKPAAAASMGQRAWRHIQTAFRWDDHVGAYESLFQAVAATGRRCLALLRGTGTP